MKLKFLGLLNTFCPVEAYLYSYTYMLAIGPNVVCPSNSQLVLHVQRGVRLYLPDLCSATNFTFILFQMKKQFS